MLTRQETNVSSGVKVRKSTIVVKIGFFVLAERCTGICITAALRRKSNDLRSVAKLAKKLSSEHVVRYLEEIVL